MLSRTKNTILYVLLIVASSLISSCRPTPQYPEALLLADSLTQCNADSAVRLLQELAPTMSQAKEPVRCYHQLLTIKAQDKAFIPHTSDSLVLTLLRYYQEEGDPRLLPEACYYAGRVTRDLGDAPQALDYFHQALDALQTSDYQSRMQGQEERTLKLQGKIHAQMGYLFRRQHLYDEAIKAMEEAYKMDSLNLDTMGMILDLSDIGSIHKLLKQFTESFSYYEKAERYALIKKDSILLFVISIQKANLYSISGKTEEVKEALTKYPQYASKDSSSIYSILAKVYSNIGEVEKAKKYYEFLLTSDEIIAKSNANLWLGNQAIKTANAEDALQYLRNYMILEDSIRNLKNEEAIALTQSLYNYQLREKKISELKIRENSLKAQSWMYIALAAIAIILLYIERARRQKIKRQYDHIQRLIASGKQHSNLKSELSLATTADLKESDTYKRIRQKYENKMTLNKADWAAIEKLFDTAMPEFLPKLRGIQTFNDTEWKLCLLTKMDFSWHEIASLVSRSYDAIYSSQNRLHKKVFKGDVTFRNWKEFINSL